MRARSFFYVCAGLLALTIAYGIGASTARGQLGKQLNVIEDPIVGITSHANGGDRVRVVTAGGRVWFTSGGTGGWSEQPPVPLADPISVDPATMGRVKKKYRDED